MIKGEIHILDRLRVLYKHRWIAASVFITVVVSAAVVCFTMKPVYQGTAVIVIEKEDPSVVSFKEVFHVDTSASDYYQTQYKIIESRAVAAEVVRRLGLDRYPEFNPAGRNSFLGDIGAIVSPVYDFVISLVTPSGKKGAETEASVAGGMPGKNGPDYAGMLMKRISVRPVRQSRIVNISAEAEDPLLAASIANTIVKAYIDHNLSVRLEAVKDAANWLNERLAEERTRVELSEKALLDYKEKNGIVTDFSNDSETITAQKLAKLNDQVVQAEAKRVEAETRYRQTVNLQGVAPDSLPEVLRNPLLQEIKKAEVELVKQASELAGKYGMNHPKMQAIQSELGSVQRRKAAEVQRIVDSLKHEYEVALAGEQSLKSALAAQKQETLGLNQKAVEYGVLKREAESARAMYDVLIKRFKETTVTQDINTSNIHLVDKAEVPKTPVRPKTALSLIIAILGGACLAVATAFFLEYLDNSIKLPDDIEKYLKLPSMGLVPSFRLSGNGKASEGGIARELISVHSLQSAASEAYRAIRTKILFSAAEHPPKCIVVASTSPREGKTITAANLAASMAMSGHRVLAIDCDMRKPRLHKVFGMERERGISNVLVGECDIESSIVGTHIPNLDIISSGPIPPNPAELLGSNRMAQILELLRAKYDHIIIDTPPVAAVTDAVVLSKLVDGVVVVVRANKSPRKLVLNGLNLIRSLGAHVLGGVLNDVPTDRNPYYYGYYYQYTYYSENGESRKAQRKKVRRHSKSPSNPVDDADSQSSRVHS